MKIVFTKNNYPLSILIRKITGENVSHLAIVFDDIFLVELNLFGVSMNHFGKFKKKQKIIHEVDIKLIPEQEEKIWKSMIEFYGLYKYDIVFLLYSAFCVIVKRLFKKEIKKKILDDDKKALCYELILLLQNSFNFNFGIEENKKHLLTPGKIYTKLKESGY